MSPAGSDEGCTLCDALDTNGHGAAHRGKKVDLRAGTILVREGAPAIEIATIATGCTMAFKRLAADRRQVTGFHLPGELLALPSSTPRSDVTVVALVPTVVCRHDFGSVEMLCRHHPSIARRLVIAGGDKLDAARAHMVLLGRKTADERVASFLLDLSRRLHHSTSRGIELPMLRSDIADYLGLTTETVSRVLSRLKASGCLVMPTPGKAMIGDMTELAAIAGGGVKTTNLHLN